jgi:ubiquinone/menaquinone biosynthesis C-methylase UbiE
MQEAFMARDRMQGEVAAQRAYYEAKASRYDEAHVSEGDEHSIAASMMISFFDLLGIRSILDIGAGTGRALLMVKERSPGVRAIGVEPVAGLREQGYRKGLSRDQLVDGDAHQLAYVDGAFDMVCGYGVLHHVPDPDQVVAEMLRVARKAIFISDSNNFGQGGPATRATKQIIDAAGLWPAANYIKTRGKGYSVSEGDGIAYSYSVFNQYRQIDAQCASVHMMNTMNSGPNLYRSASHVALLGIKRNVS